MAIHDGVEYGYPLLIFALAALSFGVERLMQIKSVMAVAFSSIAMALGLAVTVVALAHYWRHH